MALLQTKTVLEWLFRKGLLFSNELLAGQAFALLIEWRIASYSALDSTTIFARKFTESLPPYHLPQRVRVSDAFIQ